MAIVQVQDRRRGGQERTGLIHLLFAPPVRTFCCLFTILYETEDTRLLINDSRVQFPFPY